MEGGRWRPGGCYVNRNKGGFAALHTAGGRNKTAAAEGDGRGGEWRGGEDRDGNCMTLVSLPLHITTRKPAAAVVKSVQTSINAMPRRRVGDRWRRGRVRGEGWGRSLGH